MRVALLMAVILALGLLGSTNAQCILKNDSAVCQKLNDVGNIDSHHLKSLKAYVLEKTLRSTSLKNLSPSLKSLDLSDGEIEIIEPGAFVNMTGLVDLKMSDNSIAQFKESALNGLQKLKNFDLRRNNIRQLSPALTKLKALKNLEVSGNPLICNCDTLHVRDDLLENGVKISKKVFCHSPSNLKGVSLLEPEAEVICMFEEQDKEMQADEAAGSGDAEDNLPEYMAGVTDVPPDPSLGETDSTPEIISDDLIIPVMGRSRINSSPVESTEASSSSDTSKSSTPDSSDDSDDFVFSSVDGQDDSLILVEGSGATEPEYEGSGEEGSGEKGSGIWEPINPSDFLDEDNELKSSTTEGPTTAEPSWYDVFWSAIGGDSDPTTPSSVGDSDKSLTDEQFFTVASGKTTTSSTDLSDNDGVTEDEVVTKKADILESTNAAPSPERKLEKIGEDFADTDADEDTSIDDIGEASTRQSKKSMGSYVVLAALLGVLGALVGFAAYKSSICKKKSNNDPERGSELKDIQKSLLDPNNTNQPKIASNGNAESAPLVEPNPDPWTGPQEIRQWTDQHNAPMADNGTKYTPSGTESDPVKPPRKSLPPQDEPNGLQEVKTHSPMSTFAPRPNGSEPNSVTPPNSPSSVTEDGNHSPPLSPNTQRVKITLQDNPDSVPKTPILITRTKPGVNLVKTP